ncbi:MAG TPA: methyltransferase regulatory domain-containing protein [Caldimonas sp.]|nr:methyltransferase regulatory domain-containing protein [Caldimonas sp.]
MGTWQDGYVTDIPYTAGFYRELSPAYLHLLAILVGVRPPAVVDRQFAYCELGCGRGLGPLLLAATNPLGRFHGYDFNAAQMAKLRHLGARAGLAKLHFGERSFADLAAQSGAADAAPRFDLIVLHGVYSWVSAENRRHIAHFIRDRLEPGGMVYVSYNCMPGWAAFTPVQRLLRELVVRRRGRSDENAVAAVQFVDHLAARGARYFKADASIGRYLEHLGARDGSYLAHEYLNEHWDALYHLDVKREMNEAGLDYVGSAAASENIPALSASPEIAAMFAGADPGMAETIKDFAVNRRFRRDLYVHEPVQLTPPQFVAALAAIRFTLTVDPQRATTTLDTSAGMLTADEAVIEPMLERLKQGSVGFAELASLPAFAEVPPLQIAQGLALLVESAQAHPMLEEDGGAARSASLALNDLLVEEAQGGDDSMRFLAAPALGSGVFVTHSEQLLLSAMREVGSDSVEAIRDSTWAQFKAQDKRIVKDGRPLDGDADNLAELEPRVRSFLEHRLPLLRRLGVVAGPKP